jgi:hypothetical protein
MRAQAHIARSYLNNFEGVIGRLSFGRGYSENAHDVGISSVWLAWMAGWLAGGRRAFSRPPNLTLRSATSLTPRCGAGP